jgi:putative FmdB family regulatory protein
MPLYEYRCKACGHRFEKIQSFSAPDEKECPVCHGEVERLISAPAVQFKGSGFYSTDYVSKPSAPKADGASKDGAPSSSEGGKDSPSSSSTDGAAKSGSGSESSRSPAPTSSTPASSASTASSSNKS